MIKKELRERVLNQMTRVLKNNRFEISRDLMKRLVATAAYQEASTVATYLSFEHEVDTTYLISQAQKDGKKVLVPKIIGPGKMIFVAYDESNLVAGTYGILEPSTTVAMDKAGIDLIHVPGVVFREDGYRIGYGGGFYDRYLQDYRGQTIATLLACQLSPFPKASHDIPVKELIIDETTVQK